MYTPDNRVQDARLLRLSDVLPVAQENSSRECFIDLEHCRLYYPAAFFHLTSYDNLTEESKNTYLAAFEYSLHARSSMNPEFDFDSECADMIEYSRMATFGRTGQYPELAEGLLNLTIEITFNFLKKSFRKQLFTELTAITSSMETL